MVARFLILYSQAAQQTLRGVAESFKSYKELSKKYLNGELENRPQLPNLGFETAIGCCCVSKATDTGSILSNND